MEDKQIIAICMLSWFVLCLIGGLVHVVRTRSFNLTMLGCLSEGFGLGLLLSIGLPVVCGAVFLFSYFIFKTALVAMGF